MRETAVDHRATADEQHDRQPDAGEEAQERASRTPAGGSSTRSGRTPVDTECRNRPSMCSSRANAFTTRIPETLSSASAVSSASRCWTSCSAGREQPAEPHGRQHHERNREQGQRRQPRVDHEHHRARQHDRQRVLGEEDQAVAEEEADRLEVHGRPRHQLTGLLRVEEPQLQLLQPAVDPLAQVELDRHARPCRRSAAAPRSGRDAALPPPGSPERAAGSRRDRPPAARSHRPSRRPATGSGPSSPSPARRTPGSPAQLADTGVGSRADA